MNLAVAAMPIEGLIICTSLIDFEKLSCKCFTTWIDTWILNFGASHHVTFTRSSFLDNRIMPYPLFATLLNGYKVRVTEIGSVSFSPQITLHRIMFVPSFKFHLIYISPLTALFFR